MGSKGSNTTTTNQSQTYNPAGASYIQNALNQGQNAAQLPFNIPQAPVAGFSGQQQQAFGLVGNAQGMAQPYYQQAQNLFNQSAQGPDVSQFFNPYAGAVTSQLNNIFGQQNVQNTGSLTQAAGGVGADRIAVGQGNLANQQGLAAGQTLAGLYAPSLQAAQQQQNIQQSAAYGLGSLGSQAENTALSGANALLGTGGLQQQLSQAQLNAPYQQQLAQAAFPYQQAQFNAGITGALAPGLGGTTTGYGQTTAPAPSLLSQILGGGAAATGILGGTGAFGSNGYLTGSNGLFGGSGKGSNPSAAGTPGSPYYGPVNSGGYAGGGGVANFDSGGGVPEMMQRMAMYNQLNGASPSGFSAGSIPNSTPINADQQSIIPTGQTPSIQAHMPNLNLTPPSPQQSNSGGLSSIVGPAMQIAKMFAKDGGAINPYDGNKAFHPYFADAGVVPDPGDDPSPATFDERFPYRTATPEGMDAWRKGAQADIAAGQGATPDSPTMQALSYSGDTKTPPPAAAGADAATSPAATPPPAQAGNPYSAPTPAAPDDAGQSFIKSPWAALTAAGLGIMGGTSPFAGVNIGQGAMQGLKTLEQQRTEGQKDETVKQAAERLRLEAKFHEDQFTRSTPYQQFEMNKPVQIGRNIWGQPVFGVLDQKTGAFVDPATKKPVDLSQIGDADEDKIHDMAKAVANYDQPPISANKATTQVGMAIMNEARRINPQYDTKNFDEAKNAKVKFGAGPQGDAIRSFGTAYRHIDVLDNLITAMNSGDEKTINRIKNAWQTEFGTSAAPNNVQAARSIVSDEIIKAVIGARGALGDREDAQKQIDAANSPQLTHKLITDVYKPLMMGQLLGYKQQYESSTHGAKDFGEKLTPAIADDLEKAAAAQKPATPATPATPAATAATGTGGAQLTPEQKAASVTAARAAIAAHPEIKAAVIKRLQDNGIDASGL